MCGIHLQVLLRGKGTSPSTCCEYCRELFSFATDQTKKHNNLYRRGPDSQDVVSMTSNDDNGAHRIQFHASVLRMRHDLMQQPVRIVDGVYLCWNGELYQTLDNDDNEEEVWNYEMSDTKMVANRLRDIFSEENNNHDDKQIQKSIANTMSSFYNAEFAFLIVTPSRVYYGRDSWGRRSLLRYDCASCRSFQIASTSETLLPDQEEKTDDNDDCGANSSMWKEILPGQVHQSCLLFNNNASEEIPLSSVPFPIVSIPQKATHEKIRETMLTLYKDDVRPPDNVSKELLEASFGLEFHLNRAIQMRISTSHKCIGVLFSGGLDSAVVAAIAARHCHINKQVLYLYNVSFGSDENSYEKSADRKAALVTYDVLKEKYGGDVVIFRDIKVRWEQLSKWEPHIRTLLQPKTTLMDINIAAAIWFAASGGDILLEKAKDENKEGSSSISSKDHHPRVLLLGMGADEQMGGYGRHRKAYDRGGWEELQKELDMDKDRFWERNLGRDDRICADHSKEARFPFLDANVTKFLHETPLDLICDFALPPGQGDKRILRLVAMRLGIHHASGLVKRAIQFGSRISHLSDAKRFGSRRKAKGTHKA